MDRIEEFDIEFIFFMLNVWPANWALLKSQWEVGLA